MAPTSSSSRLGGSSAGPLVPPTGLTASATSEEGPPAASRGVAPCAAAPAPAPAPPSPTACPPPADGEGLASPSAAAPAPGLCVRGGGSRVLAPALVGAGAGAAAGAAWRSAWRCVPVPCACRCRALLWWTARFQFGAPTQAGVTKFEMACTVTGWRTTSSSTSSSPRSPRHSRRVGRARSGDTTRAVRSGRSRSRASAGG